MRATLRFATTIAEAQRHSPPAYAFVQGHVVAAAPGRVATTQSLFAAEAFVALPPLPPPPGHVSRCPRLELLLFPRTVELNAAESALSSLALVALVGGNRPPVSPAQVREHLQSFYNMPEDAFTAVATCRRTSSCGSPAERPRVRSRRFCTHRDAILPALEKMAPSVHGVRRFAEA